MPGILHIIATPIGNLQDISVRALETLKQVDLIAAEDTRHSKKLLSHFLIETPLTALHDHNETQKVHGIVDRLTAGENVALISDAGTPLISDPGYRLVRTAQMAGIKISPVPGPCAAIAALSAGGMPSDRFHFEGFLSAKSSARKKRLKALSQVPATLIFYESPHRILDFMKDVIDVLGGDRELVVARELTKTFETIHRDTAASVLKWMQSDANQQRGEFVILLQGDIAEHEDPAMEEALRIYDILSKELSSVQAVKLAASITGVKKNQLYQLCISDNA